MMTATGKQTVRFTYFVVSDEIWISCNLTYCFLSCFPHTCIHRITAHVADIFSLLDVQYSFITKQWNHSFWWLKKHISYWDDMLKMLNYLPIILVEIAHNYVVKMLMSIITYAVKPIVWTAKRCTVHIFRSLFIFRVRTS